MDFEDKFLAKVSGVQSFSSSVQSTPEKNGHSDDASRSPELLQDFLKSGPRRELQSYFDKEKKHSTSSKSKMTEHPKTKKSFKNQESKIVSCSPNKQSSSRKQHRKGENPIRLLPATEHSSDFGCSNSWICKNSACRASLSTDDTFCKRCSCCICHLFDDNKDPSLWLTCTSEPDQGYSCGLSCHIECAFQRKKVGVVDLGQLMQLDGSYCCASCGKVSGILGVWKKQLLIAKEARRVDVLCFRILMSYRLLDGTSRFKEMHEIVKDAKAKLESEVGPIDGDSAKLARGIVSRLSIAGDMQKLCSLAIEKANEWLTSISNANSNGREDSLPAACKFLFEEVSSSSVVIVLIELSTTSSDTIKGYKLWYCKSRDETHPKEPICVFPRDQRRILISNLQPCTEYTFRIVSYTECGDLGHSEAKCFTKSVEIIHKNLNSEISMNVKKEKSLVEGSCSGVKEQAGFKVRDLGKVLHLAWAQEQGSFEGLCCAEVAKCKAVTVEGRGLDLPDLNEEVAPPFDFARDEDSREVSVESRGKKRAAPTEETQDCDSTLINASPLRIYNKAGSLDENFEYCVKIIRWLECEGHIQPDFRMKLLTWFSLRSTDQERRVINTYIQTLIDDPKSLAAQLVDSFSDIVSSKRARNGFCSKLWH